MCLSMKASDVIDDDAYSTSKPRGAASFVATVWLPVARGVGDMWHRVTSAADARGVPCLLRGVVGRMNWETRHSLSSLVAVRDRARLAAGWRRGG